MSGENPWFPGEDIPRGYHLVSRERCWTGRFAVWDAAVSADGRCSLVTLESPMAYHQFNIEIAIVGKISK